MDLYLHIILAHFPSFFDKHSFYISTTEHLEMMFTFYKRGRYTTNRHKFNFLKNSFLRFESVHMRKAIINKEDPAKLLESMCRTDKKKKKDKFSEYRTKLEKEIEDVEFQMPPENCSHDKQISTRDFINSILNNQQYLRDIHYTYDRKTLVLLVRNDVLQYLQKTKPKEK